METPPSSPFSLATPPSSPLPISEDEEDSDDDDCIIVGYSKKIIVIDENTPIKTEFVDISDSVMNELIMACSPAHTIDLTDDENEDDDEPVRKAPPLMTYSQQQSPATYTNDLTFESCYWKTYCYFVIYRTIYKLFKSLLDGFILDRVCYFG